MKKFSVTITRVSTQTKEIKIEASSEKAARNKAMKLDIPDDGDWDVDFHEEYDAYEIR